MQGGQIFQTNNFKRWKRFKWSSRAVLLLMLLSIIILLIAYVNLFVPQFPQFNASKEVLNRPNLFLKNSALAKKYKSFRQYIEQKELTNKAPYKVRVRPGFHNLTNNSMPAGIRSAFYVNWDPGSYASLQRNIDKLNMVMPEWIFINPVTDTLVTNIDARGLGVMRSAGVHVMPMLSNVFPAYIPHGDGKFHGESVHRIIHDKSRRQKLISDLIAILEKNKLSGINVDFEELQENSDEALVSFQKELYEQFHAKGLLVSQDLIPFNSDYDFNNLSRYNDFVFLMAYDEFSPSSKPGPVAEQKWIQAALDDAVKKIPANKIILGMPAYGYDWSDDEDLPTAITYSYQQSLSRAKVEQARIEFDNDSYNLHYSYYDEDTAYHDVYFTDAATSFNAMRFATESEIAGVALWRLGSEDERIWQFYNRNMSKDSIKKFDFQKFALIQSTDNDVAYNGQGEILDVIAAPSENGVIKPEIDSVDILIAEENYDSLPAPYMAKKFGWNGSKEQARNKKKIVLTFDDGPDPTWTPKVLDILSEKHVPASFFLVGLNAENNIPLVKRIYREGHEIGNHTFTHPNIANVNHKRAVIEIETTRLLIECITGHSTVLFRAPYNADFTPTKREELLPVAIARQKNYLDVGESVDPEDWVPGISADTIFQRIVDIKAAIDTEQRAATGGNIILLHDAGGDTRRATLEALPRIIDYYKSRGYQFTTIADLLGKKKEDLMPSVPKGSGYYLIEASYIFFEATYYLEHILTGLFLVFIGLSICRVIFMAYLTINQRRAEKKAGFVFPGSYPAVSIIVPAYNEELNAVQSLQNLLKTDYPNFEIIFVDDGSNDDTYGKVSDIFLKHPKVRVFTKPNGGKASALNFGIAQAKADYVVCIDADTKLKPDAVSQLMKHFFADDSASLGAVAGNVKVGNEVNLLTKWQAIEYISSQNFDRRAFAYLNAITVVPGAIGAFRKKAIEETGGFTTDTLAEDCDISIRILRAGYVIKNEGEALAFTEAPEKTKQFIKQRFRWSFGVLQTFWKHRDVLFSKKYKWLGWVAMPNILLFQYVIPAFIPLADLFMLVSAMTGNGSKILPYYIAFMIFDAGIAMFAFRMEKETISRLVWLIPQRLIYRWLMWYVLFKAFRKAIKGELQNWGVLKRTGSVKEVGIA